MDIPAYVPQGAREHARHFLGHYEPLLSTTERELAETEQAIREWSSRIAGRPPAEIPESYRNKLKALYQRRKEKNHWRDRLTRDIASIHRVIHDSRMKNAYRLLSDALFDEADEHRQALIDGFLYAAWAARLDFSLYREKLKRAAQLRDDIAATADKLAGLLREAMATGRYPPPAFFSIPELLRQTDCQPDDHNFHMWKVVRGTVVGDSRQEALETDPAEQARNSLRYSWGIAPPLSDLLGTLAHTARDWQPAEAGFIGAAISSRKQNSKTEYLRAFGNLLITEHGFILTAPIFKAMAVTAMVVMNDPDIDVTEDDVRKALARIIPNPLEDSDEK